MCLGMGNCCENVPPKTEGSKKYTKVLLGLMLAELCIAMCKMFIIDLFQGFMELILIFILFMAYNQVSYCHCIMYIIFAMYNLIFACVTIATIIQNGTSMFPGKDQKPVNPDQEDSPLLDYTTQGVIMTYILIVFYTAAIYVVFQAYKEFKSEALVYGPRGGGFGMGGQQQQQQGSDGQPILGQQYQQGGGYGAPQTNAFGQNNASNRGDGIARFGGQAHSLA